MEKSKKQKLLELRAKKITDNKQADLKKHSEIINALNSLHALFSDDKNNSTEKLLNKLSELESLKEEVTAVKQAIENLPQVENVAISNLSELIEQQKDVDFTEVTNAINALSEEVKNQAADSVTIENKKPEEYIPTRRVIEKQGRLVFDDKPMEVTVVGGGGGATIAGVQKELTRNDNAIAIVNPDGTPISLDGVTMTERFAAIGGYDYIGEAPVGTLTSANSWTISRYNASEGKVALNAIWDNYLTEVYL